MKRLLGEALSTGHPGSVEIAEVNCKPVDDEAQTDQYLTEKVQTEFVVCGWFTDDLKYQIFAEKLMADLDALGIEHDFVQIPKPAAKSWEETTRLKPFHLLRAITKYPGRTIILLDVDARIHGPLDQLAAIPGDVGLYVRTKFRRRGGVRFSVRSGTAIFRPTKGALQLAHFWLEAARKAPYGAEDQQCLLVALGQVPGLTIHTLSVRYCATEGDRCINPIIAHDQASKGVRKIRTWQKLLRSALQWHMTFPILWCLGMVALATAVIWGCNPLEVRRPGFETRPPESGAPGVWLVGFWEHYLAHAVIQLVLALVTGFVSGCGGGGTPSGFSGGSPVSSSTGRHTGCQRGPTQNFVGLGGVTVRPVEPVKLRGHFTRKGLPTRPWTLRGKRTKPPGVSRRIVHQVAERKVAMHI